jgi:predicted lipoprotein with Yx(FWY)xxD motif
MQRSFLLITLLAVGIVACKDDEQEVYPEVQKAGIQLVENSTFGKILSDKDGRTLYFFSRDTKLKSVCEGGCLDAWPIFYSENLSASEGLNVSDFSTVTRTDGLKQTSYKGFPLYYFNQDAQAGDTKGEGVSDAWFVAKTDYSVFYVKSQLVGADTKSYKANYTLENYIEGTEETFYLTDANGRTLYSFRNDKNGMNNFSGNAAVWPVFSTEFGKLVVPSVLDKADFGEITKDGNKQLTYKGWPLYYFGGNADIVGDLQPGDNRGVSVPMPGVWPVVNTSTIAAPAAPSATIKISENNPYGKILTDQNGRTLYFFSRDTKGTSVCLDGCVTAWPIFYSETIVVAAGLDVADFTTITRTDGAKQTVYKGFPLYYFNQDAQVGETKGENINKIWFVAKPDYSVFYEKAQLVGADAKSYIANYTLANYVEGQEETFYMTDAKGRTIYTFRVDKNGVNNFGGDPATWPVFSVDFNSLVVPSALDKADFGEITKDGNKQLTYKGWPLYYFGGTPNTPGDTNSGDTRGVSVPLPGVWPVANAATTIAPN